MVETRRRQKITFAVLTISVCSYTLMQSLVIPVMSTIQTEMDTDQATVTWVLTAYLLAASVATPLFGRIGDGVGKRLVLVVSLLLLCVGSVMAALAPGIGWLIAARAVQGLGGGVMPLAFGIVRDQFGDRTTGGISVLSSLTAVGFATGMVLAGPIDDALGFRWLFWLPAIVTAIAALAALRFVPESTVRTPGRLPLLPAALLTISLVALLLGVSQGNTWGWVSGRVLGLFALAAITAVAWVRAELAAPSPMVDMRMMTTRGVWTTNLCAAFVGFGLYASMGFLPQFVQTPSSAGYGFDATISESGQMLLPTALATFAVGFVTAWMIARVGSQATVAGGTLVSGIAFGLLAFFHDEVWQVVVLMGIQGLGTGLVFAALAGIVLACVPAHQAGVASGMNANIRTIGGAIGSAVMAGVVTAHVASSGLPLERGYTLAFLLLGTSMIAAAVVTLWMPDIRRQPTTSPLIDADNAELGLVAGAPAAR